MTHSTSHINTNTAAATSRGTGPALDPREIVDGARVLLLAPPDLELEHTVAQLAADGVDTVTATGAEAARVRLAGEQPNAILVVSELAGGASGYATAEELRYARTVLVDTPAIALCPGGEPLDITRALQRGCVDAMSVPLFYPELLLRLALAMTRGRRQGRVLSIDAGHLVIDLDAQTVQIDGEPLTLARREFELLAVLAGDPSRVHTKQELLRAVWGFSAATRSRTLDSHACRLRTKLRAAGAPYVHTVWGAGYRLCGAS